MKLCKNIFVLIFSILLLNVASIQAEELKSEVSGYYYKFEDSKHYEFEGLKSDTTLKNYGVFSIGGNVADISELDGFSAYGIDGSDVNLYYTYSDQLLRSGIEEFHLVEDGSNKINGLKVNSKIKKGALLLQSSKDGKNWKDEKYITNLFEEIPIQKESFIKLEQNQIEQGTYYRVIVAYRLGKKVGNNNLFNFIPLPGDKMEYIKIAQVYNVYIYDRNKVTINIDNKITLGERKKYKANDGYYNEESLANDIHNGWHLGKFFLEGYTKYSEKNNENILLKNVGDSIKLSFKIEQDINRLNNDSNYVISNDTDGRDEYFGIKKEEEGFGKGALIIKHTNFQGDTKINVHRDYLTKIVSNGDEKDLILSEEGDYEIALDYEIENKNITSIFNKYTNYQIFIKFKVRNGNSMVFPFDVKTNEELTNASSTENGFYLDLAKSRYLDVFVKKEVLNRSSNKLENDVRFNTIVKDKQEFVDEGIYTITVKNNYTDLTTVKKIYVGKDELLQQSVQTGIDYEQLVAKPNQELNTTNVESTKKDGIVWIIGSVVSVGLLGVVGYIYLKRKGVKR